MLTQYESIENMGGIIKAWFIYTSDVELFIKQANSHDVIVTLKEGSNWVPLYMTPNAKLEEPYTDDENPTLWSPTLSLRYPIKSASLTHQQRLLMGQKLIVKVETSNGHILYIGTPDYPAGLVFGHLVGALSVDYSGYGITLKAIQPFPMLFDFSSWAHFTSIEGWAITRYEGFNLCPEIGAFNVANSIGEISLDPLSYTNGVSIWITHELDEPTEVTQIKVNVTEMTDVAWGGIGGQHYAYLRTNIGDQDSQFFIITEPGITTIDFVGTLKSVTLGMGIGNAVTSPVSMKVDYIQMVE